MAPTSPASPGPLLGSSPGGSDDADPDHRHHHHHHHHHHHFSLPPLSVLALRAVPRIVEGVVVPTVVFVVLLRYAGAAWAIAGGLAWSLTVIGTRVALGRRVPALALVGLAALTLRTALALAAHSSFVYFLQPTIGTAIVGVALLGSALAGRPLVLRLARDFCPLPADTMANTPLRRLFLGLSALWGLVQLTNAGLTLWLLLSQSTGIFVVARATMAYALTGAGIVVSVLWFRRVTGIPLLLRSNTARSDSK